MSIKRKFATAVATASLLAGLFGSALVSTASAAGRIGGAGVVSAAKSLIKSAEHDGTYDTVWLNTTVASSDDGTRHTGAKDFFADLNDAVTDSDNNQAIEYTMRTASDGPVTLIQELSATSSSSVIDVAWKYNDDGTEATDCEDADVGPDATNWTTSDIIEGAAEMTADEEYILCVYPNRAGKATITVKADGVTLPAVTVTVFGDLATLTLSVRNGHPYVAADNAGVDRYFRVVGKDSAGQVLNGTGDGAYAGVAGDLAEFALVDSSDNPSFANDGAPSILGTIEDWTSTDYSAFYDEEDNDWEFGFARNDFDLEDEVCAADDAGKTYAIAVEATNYDSDTVTSNTVSITCTGDEAKVTDLSVEATGGAKKYNETGVYANDQLSILATIVDQANRPMGVGVTVNFDVAIEGDASLDETALGDIDFVGSTYNGAPLGNKVRVGYLEPDVARKAVYPYTVTLANSDLGADDEVVYSEDFTYTVDASAVEKTYTISVVRNAAKTRATMTVNFGAACSRQMVDFDVELANGDVKYLTRRADINGVAKLTMERRNTKIYVTAFCGGSAVDGYDLESELRGVRFR